MSGNDEGKDLAAWYKRPVIESIANALGYPIEMEPGDYCENWKNGIIIPVAKIHKNDESIFPLQEYDWQAIRRTVEGYTGKVIADIHKRNTERRRENL